jgi:hypothetical protein
MKYLIALSVLGLQSAAYASGFAPPSGPPTVSETLLSKDFPFITGFFQSLKEVTISGEKITLVPKEGTGEIPTARLCATHSLDDQRFEKLRSITFTAISRAPSAKAKSEFGGTTTIGSDQILMFANVPDLRDPGGSSINARAVIETVFADPSRKTNRSIETGVSKNKVVLSSNDTKSTNAQAEYNFLQLSIEVMAENEGHPELAKEMAAVQVSAKAYSTETLIEDSFFAYEDSIARSSSESIYTYNVSDESNIKATKPPEKVENKKELTVCWYPNNYSSVTTEPAELFNPTLTLEYLK